MDKEIIKNIGLKMQQDVNHIILSSFNSDNTKTSCVAAELTLNKIDNMIEKLKPKHAILLNEYISDNNIFEINNYNQEKYYCKKLLLINKKLYESKLKYILERENINIRVYNT